MPSSFPAQLRHSLPTPLPLMPSLESSLPLGSELDHKLHEDGGQAHFFNAVSSVVSSVPAPHPILSQCLSDELMPSWLFSKPFVTIYVIELVIQVQVSLTRMGA